MKLLYKKTDSDREIKLTRNRRDVRSAFRRDNSRIIHSAVFRRLQGKTQLFPCYESDFFRNRLTHSLEVAQIAKGIAEIINKDKRYEYFKGENKIDLNIVETAALAHDLGHPPFGHNGEKALNSCMKGHGGFEGNAQTLRILTKLEKKQTFAESSNKKFKAVTDEGVDNRCGLNLTYRTLASVLKYDKEIVKEKDDDDVVKGYYYTEKNIVKNIKKHVVGSRRNNLPIQTIECQIMELADDIAYATYDLEDAFKAEFLSPLDILSSDEELLEKVCAEIKNKSNISKIKPKDIRNEFVDIYKDIFQLYQEDIIGKVGKSDNLYLDDLMVYLPPQVNTTSKRICCSGYYRTGHTSKLIKDFISSIKVKLEDKNHPELAKVYLPPKKRKSVEILKRYNYVAIIKSPRVKITEFRGEEIVKEIFENLNKSKGHNLLPDDFRDLYNKISSKSEKKRVICDFIAGMTDRYAVEFYSRLKSENPQTIFKPF